MAKVRILEGVYAVANTAMPFIVLLGDGRVMTAVGATITELGDGKYLATAFNGERRLCEVLELRDLRGTPTLSAAAN